MCGAWRVLVIRVVSSNVAKGVTMINYHSGPAYSSPTSWSKLSLTGVRNKLTIEDKVLTDKHLTIKAWPSLEACHPLPRGHTPGFVARLDCEALKVCVSVGRHQPQLQTVSPSSVTYNRPGI